MTKNKTIYIRNIYYMLAYALQVLRQKNYERVAIEDFEDADDLFAEILYLGISRQLKQGLYREYIERTDDMPGLRGKLDLRGSIHNQIQRKRILSCTYDELSVNNLYNQILKKAVVVLLADSKVQKQRKEHLHKVFPFLAGIDDIEVSAIRWDSLRYQRNNWNYEMLMNISWLVLDRASQIQTTEAGRYKLAAFSDERMEKVFERFILEYFRRHQSKRVKARAAEVRWNITIESAEATEYEMNMIQFLPKMQTDIFLEHGKDVLIIDAKYYSKTMARNNGGREKFHSANMYQIFTYVKNYHVDKTKNVSGMLLYAKTDEEIVPNGGIMMDGNRIAVRTLDLNQPFDQICGQLDQIADEYFKENPTESVC